MEVSVTTEGEGKDSGLKTVGLIERLCVKRLGLQFLNCLARDQKPFSLENNFIRTDTNSGNIPTEELL